VAQIVFICWISFPTTIRTGSTDPNQWPGFNLSFSTATLLTLEALLSLHHFSDATISISFFAVL